MARSRKPAGGGVKTPAAPKAPAEPVKVAEAGAADGVAEIANGTVDASGIGGVVEASLSQAAAVVAVDPASTDIQFFTNGSPVISTAGPTVAASDLAPAGNAAGEDDDDVDLIEVIARSRDGKPFRRCGIDWTGDFQTVNVSIETAERLATDPNLLVKNVLVKAD